MKDANFFPFYCKEAVSADPNKYCDLSKDVAVIRGIRCKKKHLDADVPIYKDGKRLERDIFYWVPMNGRESSFEIGLELLGKKTESSSKRRKGSLTSFFSIKE
jgi:hypothetical protein